MPADRSGFTALFATSLIQIVASFAVSAPLAISVLIVAQAHVPEAWIGYYTSLLYLAAIAGSLLTPRLLGFVGIGAIQLGGLVAIAIGAALFTQLGPGPAGVALAVAGIAAMGLAYGVIVPSSALFLADRFARQWQPLVVSIRQTGVPVGTAIVAIVAPLVAQRWGWTAMAPVIAMVVAAAFALAAPTLAGVRRAAPPPVRPAAGLAGLRLLLGNPAARRLALVAGIYGLNQAALTTYLVPSLIWLHHLSLGRAAGFLATATLAGAAARIVFGLTTARFGGIDVHLGLIGITSGLAWGLLLWPDPALAQLTLGALLLGATAMGWNGILLAELAHAAPAGRTADLVGIGTAMAYFGVLVAPFVYGWMLALSGSKAVAVAALALLSVLAGAALLRKRSVAR